LKQNLEQLATERLLILVKELLLNQEEKNRQIKVQNKIFIILGVIGFLIGLFLLPTAPIIGIILIILIVILIFAISKIYKKHD